MRNLIGKKRAIRTALLSAMLAFPMLGASECSDLTGADDSSSSSYDGDYDLVSVDGQSLPYNMIYVDSRNRLVLQKGTWNLTGRTLRTQMYTFSYVNGVYTQDPKYYPERHSGTVTISGNTATGTLDTGSSVSTTFSSGTMLTSYNGHRMQFVKR